MTSGKTGQSIGILLVDDNTGDVRLVREAFKDGKMFHRLNVARDGVQAMDRLKRRGKYINAVRPDLILLDLNLPKKDGREVLAEIKSDPDLKRIPVVILTSSQTEEDVIKTYDLHANCYINKPIDLERFTEVMRAIEDFWLNIVKLPPNGLNRK